MIQDNSDEVYTKWEYTEAGKKELLRRKEEEEKAREKTKQILAEMAEDPHFVAYKELEKETENKGLEFDYWRFSDDDYNEVKAFVLKDKKTGDIVVRINIDADGKSKRVVGTDEDLFRLLQKNIDF